MMKTPSRYSWPTLAFVGFAVSTVILLVSLILQHKLAAFFAWVLLSGFTWVLLSDTERTMPKLQSAYQQGRMRWLYFVRLLGFFGVLVSLVGAIYDAYTHRWSPLLLLLLDLAINGWVLMQTFISEDTILLQALVEDTTDKLIASTLQQQAAGAPFPPLSTGSQQVSQQAH